MSRLELLQFEDGNNDSPNCLGRFEKATMPVVSWLMCRKLLHVIYSCRQRCPELCVSIRCHSRRWQRCPEVFVMFIWLLIELELKVSFWTTTIRCPELFVSIWLGNDDALGCLLCLFCGKFELKLTRSSWAVTYVSMGVILWSLYGNCADFGSTPFCNVVELLLLWLSFGKKLML
jgi:hypothetical protein